MISHDEWVRRYAARLAQLNLGSTPADYTERARERWTVFREVDPEKAAEDEHATRPPEQQPKAPPDHSDRD